MNKLYAITLIIVCFVLACSCAYKNEADAEVNNIESKTPQPSPVATVEKPVNKQNEAGKNTAAETAMPEISASQKLLNSMTAEEKIGQLFICALRKNYAGAAYTTMSAETEKLIKNYHIGGMVMFSENIVSAEQISLYTNELQSISKIPLFMGIDEEGGKVRRTGSLAIADTGSQMAVAKNNNPDDAYNAAKTIAGYIAPLGFNLNFAPVADIFSNPSNTVIGNRAYGKTAESVCLMLPEAVKAYNEENIICSLKHFPGHGDTFEDSHNGAASTGKTLDELRQMEFKPFLAGIEAGVPMVMAGHISAPQVNGNNEPAIFSKVLLTDFLRGEMGFEGIIITDAMDMGALKGYGADEAALKAFKAGVDIMLMPADFETAYNGILEAYNNGEISEEELDEKVLRILECKMKYLVFE